MTKGIQFALLTALISGFSIFMSKVFVSQMDPVVFTTWKNILVAVMLSVPILMPKMRSQVKTLARTDWVKLISIGIIGGSIPFALFFTGLSMTSATDATLIHKTLFIWVAIMAIMFLGERLRILQVIGYMFILIGVLWVSGFKGFSFDSGQWMILAATMLWAVENVIAKKTLKTVPFQIVAWARMTFGSMILLAIVFMQGNADLLFNLSEGQIQAVVIGAVLLTGYVLTWYKALSLAPATVVSSILVLATPITALLATGFLGISPTVPLFVSFGLLTLGVFLIVLRSDAIHRIKILVS